MKLHNIDQLKNGAVFLINKKVNWTSFDVVKKMRSCINQKYTENIKIGHAGTLDPLAEGLLIVCTGKKTKAISQFQNLKKKYQGEITIGATTPSFDLETSINRQFDFSHINEYDILTTTKKFLGKTWQKPPIYSALKQNGERLYNLARKNQSVKIAKREICIYEFNIKEIQLPKIKFEIVCSKGTYIRSIANDFGKNLKSGGYLSKLKRIGIGDFCLKDAIDINSFSSILI
tara:strand:+ start:1143 stop:1835 length:693 start_codon:yes stop_codon:yes gene_type:complete